MGRTYERLEGTIREFVERQQVFFVATAPLSRDGHVNLSPRGLATFRVLDAHTVAWLDLTGSGAETIAHLRENGRIVLLFCAFEGPPKIVRLHGRGEVLGVDDPGFGELRQGFPPLDGARAIIRVRLGRISDSCGYGVPEYEFRGQRSQLPAWTARRGAEGVVLYRAEHNRESIDGLPALTNVSVARDEPSE